MKETNQKNINNKDQEMGVRENLVQTVARIREMRRRTEQDGLSAGAGVAEDILLKDIPTLGFIVDGNLRDSNSNSADISIRVNSLPVELVEDTLAKTGFLLSLADAIPTTSVSRRLTAFLPVAMPKTQDGLTALKLIANGCRESGLLPDMGTLKERVAETNRILSKLDKGVIESTKNGGEFLQAISEQAQEIARLRLPELIVGDSEQVAGMRTLLADDKIRVLQQETVKAGGVREYSRYEIACNEIIERDRLTEQTDEIQLKASERAEKARELVLSVIARKRATGRVLNMIDEDPLLCKALANKNRMSPEDLLNADEITKRRIANNALDSRPIILLIEERKAFSGEIILKNERQKLGPILRDPLLCESELTDEEKETLARLSPNISDRRSVFDIAKDRFKKEVEDGISNEELLDALTKKITRELLLDMSSDAVDISLKEMGVNPNSVLSNPSALSPLVDGVIPVAIRNLKPKSKPRSEIKSPRIEIRRQEKTYEFTIPLVTIGKSQLVSPINLLRFGTSITTSETKDELSKTVEALIKSSKEFEGYFSPSEAAYYYPPEKKAEMLFSMVGRGAGSKLAGTPLFELRNDMDGIEGIIDPSLDRTLQSKKAYGTRVIANSVRLSPLVMRIGRQYKDRLVQATQLIAREVDVVSGNLRNVLENSPAGAMSVEKVTDYVRANLNNLLNTPNENKVPGRSVIQMDFFLLYPPEVRRKILETFRQDGSLVAMEKELARYSAEGNMKMTVFDISGGSGGVGISEILSKKVLGRESGHMRAYLGAMLGSYETRMGRLPKQVLIAPREADLTLMNFEYTEVEDALLSAGIRSVGITTLELLQQSIEVAEKTGRELQVPTLKGTVVKPELIIKRFTFPNEGKGVGYRGDILTKLPNGVILEPNNGSRIIASDKRVNSQILTALEPELDRLGVEVMPFLDLDIAERPINELTNDVVRYMNSVRNRYPEVDFLGAVLKTGDKIPGREGGAGEVISAYPVPASVMKSSEMRRLFIGKKIRELILKGVTGIIVQPNVLSLVVDNNGVLMPKFELKMMAFANRRK